MSTTIDFTQFVASINNMIASVRRRLSALEGRSQFHDYSGSYEQHVGFFVPESFIDHASWDGTDLTPTEGTARRLWNKNDKYQIRQSPAVPEKIFNLHRAMWLWVDEPVKCIRDPESGVWVVDNFNTMPIVEAVSGDIEADSDGSVTVTIPDEDPKTITNVRHRHMEGGRDLTDGTECLIQWKPKYQAWAVIEAECP